MFITKFYKESKVDIIVISEDKIVLRLRKESKRTTFWAFEKVGFQLILLEPEINHLAALMMVEQGKIRDKHAKGNLVFDMVDDVWGTYDKDNSGFLDLEETTEFVMDIMKESGEEDGFDTENFKKHFKQIDKNGDGQLDKNEFAAFIFELAPFLGEPCKPKMIGESFVPYLDTVILSPDLIFLTEDYSQTLLSDNLSQIQQNTVSNYKEATLISSSGDIWVKPYGRHLLLQKNSWKNQTFFIDRTKVASKTTPYRLFWIGNTNLIAAEMNETNNFAILSSIDGFQIGKFDATNLEFITNFPIDDEFFEIETFAKTIIAVQDKLSNKYYRASLQSLIHLGATQLNLRPKDIQSNHENLSEKLQIVGSLAPVCFSKLLINFNEAEKTANLEEQIKISEMLMKFVLRAEIKTESGQTLQAYESLTHLLCRQDQYEVLQSTLTSPHMSYWMCPHSPLQMMKLRAGKVLYTYLMTKSVVELSEIFSYFLLQELIQVLRLPETVSKDFLDAMKVDLSKENTLNPFIKETAEGALLYEDPFSTTGSLGHLKALRNRQFKQKIQEESDRRLQDLRNTMIEETDDHSQKHPVSIYMISLLFNNSPGSQESKDLLQAISEIEPNEVFNSETLQNLIRYKLMRVLPTGIKIMISYIVWLGFQTFFPKWYIVLFFFLQQAFLELLQLKGESSTVASIVFSWNFLDYLRLITMVFYIYFAARDDLQTTDSFFEECESIDPLTTECDKNHDATNIYVLMTLISWFALLQHLRMFRAYAIFLHLFVRSFQDMSSFLLVLVIIGNAFALSIFYLDTDSVGVEYEGEDFAEYLKDAYKRQWLQIYGDFDPRDDAFSMIVFFFGTLFITLFMINILIALLSGTFTEVMEQKEKHYYSEVCNLIQSYETLMFRNKNKVEKAHILFALPYVEPERSDISQQLQDLDQSVQSTTSKLEIRMQNQVERIETNMQEMTTNMNTKFEEIMTAINTNMKTPSLTPKVNQTEQETNQ